MLQTVVPALLALTFCTAPAEADASYDILFSITSDATLAGQSLEDEEVVLHRSGASSRLAWPGETFSALMGDPSGVGLHHLFGDVDAIHDPGLGGPGGEFLFSISVNEQGFLDGDVLGVVDGGYEIVISEADFMGAAGVDDGNIDIDAIHRYADGSVLFSFAEDESSNLLSGDTAGVVADGDILLWPAGTNFAQLIFTEGQVNSMVSNALGSGATTGDTKGLAVDPLTEDILFTVQSPTAHDGSVFSVGGGGVLVSGHEESNLGFDGGIELDALTVALTKWSTLEVSDPRPAPASSVLLSVNGDQPGSAYVVVWSLSLDVVWAWLPGWGGVTLAQDVLFTTSLGQTPALTVVADGLGYGSLSIPVPPLVPATDVYMQAFDLGNPHFSSNPIVVEVAQ